MTKSGQIVAVIGEADGRERELLDRVFFALSDPVRRSDLSYLFMLCRGLDMLNVAYHYLDLTPKGRDEEDLTFPMAWVRFHDAYEAGSDPSRHLPSPS